MAAIIKERPILFSGEMVRAILAGRKTQTRRVVKLHRGEEIEHGAVFTADDPFAMRPSPYGAPGDRLWVRETFDAFIDPGARKREIKRKMWNAKDQETEYWVVDYRADGPHSRIMDMTGQRRWSPSIYMPRWASRITLEITDVRVQRLQEISEADAMAEGISPALIPATGDHPDMIGYMVGPDDGTSPLDKTPVISFRKLWDSINGKRGFGWDANPWVWAITFVRI